MPTVQLSYTETFFATIREVIVDTYYIGDKSCFHFGFLKFTTKQSVTCEEWPPALHFWGRQRGATNLPTEPQ